MSDAPVRGVRQTRAAIASSRAPGLGFAGLAAALILAVGPVRAEPAIRILDLPFKVRAMRGPRSEIAMAVATSGLLPIVRGGDAAKANAPIAVVWGEEGGAVLMLENGAVAAKPVGREAVEDLAASERPRGALPGLRRALDGPLSAVLTGPTRAADGSPAATTLTLRERQPLAVSSSPKTVPVATASVPAGEGAVFAPQPPRIVPLAGRPAVLAATRVGADTGGLALVTRPTSEPSAWTVSARSAPGPRLGLAAVGDFSGGGAAEAATVDSRGALRLWHLAADAITPGPEALGFTLGGGEADMSPSSDWADTVPTEGGTDLALPVAGMPALAVVTARGSDKNANKGSWRERLRVTLPVPVGTGIVALGEGAALRLVVGLGDGRVAAIALDGGRP